RGIHFLELNAFRKRSALQDFAGKGTRLFPFGISGVERQHQIDTDDLAYWFQGKLQAICSIATSNVQHSSLYKGGEPPLSLCKQAREASLLLCCCPFVVRAGPVLLRCYRGEKEKYALKKPLKRKTTRLNSCHLG